VALIIKYKRLFYNNPIMLTVKQHIENKKELIKRHIEKRKELIRRRISPPKKKRKFNFGSIKLIKSYNNIELQYDFLAEVGECPMEKGSRIEKFQERILCEHEQKTREYIFQLLLDFVDKYHPVDNETTIYMGLHYMNIIWEEEYNKGSIKQLFLSGIACLVIAFTQYEETLSWDLKEIIKHFNSMLLNIIVSGSETLSYRHLLIVQFLKTEVWRIIKRFEYKLVKETPFNFAKYYQTKALFEIDAASEYGRSLLVKHFNQKIIEVTNLVVKDASFNQYHPKYIGLTIVYYTRYMLGLLRANELKYNFDLSNTIYGFKTNGVVDILFGKIYKIHKAFIDGAIYKQKPTFNPVDGYVSV